MIDYKKARVDTEAGYKSIELMKKYVKGTVYPEVLGGIDGFSGAFSVAAFKGVEESTLLSGTDSMGTKLKPALLMGKHSAAGIGCMTVCVSDAACAGSEPLLFLDHIACDKNVPEEIVTIAKDVTDRCSQSGSALIGGEAAKVPGSYSGDRYDLTSSAVGIVGKKDLITGENLASGDVLIGMASSSVYSSGFLPVREVFRKEMTSQGLNTCCEELGTILGKVLTAPTKICVKALRGIKGADATIRACSHITSGGFYGNAPRMLEDGVQAVIKEDSYPISPIFGLLAEKGRIEEEMMYNTCNVGLGMILAAYPGDIDKAMEAVRAAGEAPHVVDSVEGGEKGATLC